MGRARGEAEEKLLKRGATDYVLKQRLQRLPAVVRRALTESTERQQRIAVERALRETETHFRLLVDALKDYGVRHMNMPATSGKIWSIINAGPSKLAAD